MARVALAAAIVALCGCPALRAEEGSASARSAAGEPEGSGKAAVLSAFLARPVIDKDLPLREVQEFTESRVPAMPHAATAEEWEAHAERMRRGVLDGIVHRGEAARWRDIPTRVEWAGEIEGGPEYRIRKLRFEAVPGLWIPALLYEPLRLEGKVPAVLNVNGHEGMGKAVGYKQVRCINQAKRGMLALNVEWIGMGQLRGDGWVHYRMNQLDLCGTSGVAPFFLSLRRSLDVLLSHPHADPERVAVAGLSGGGWQTIFFSSLDTRVRLANPVAGYSSFRTRARFLQDLGDSEQTPCDLATVADYAHLTAMLAPRGALLTFNSKDDCCFRADHALPPLLEAARPIFRLLGREDRLRSHVNDDPGTHNFERENREVLYRAMGDWFYPGDATFSPVEITCDGEVKSPEDLAVDLPPGNATFRDLALQLSAGLPRDGALPSERATADAWRESKSAELLRVVRAPALEVKAERASSEVTASLQVTTWRLRVGEWTVPAVEIEGGDGAGSAAGTAVLVADGGRASAAAEAAELLDRGFRVVAMDPFYLGESRIPSHDFLFALLVSAVGERPLGIQAAQIAAASRWLAAPREVQEGRGLGPVSVVAVGPRACLAALVAASLDGKVVPPGAGEAKARSSPAIGSLELSGSLGSLKQVIEEDRAVNEAPEYFCFGLLEVADIRQLAALAAPRKVRLRDAGERARAELAGLDAWWRLLGGEGDPLR